MLDFNQINKAVALIQSHNSKDVENYVKYCDDFDLDPAWINCTFVDQFNNEVIVRGLRKVRAGAYWSLIVESKLDKTPVWFYVSIKEFLKDYKKI